MTDVDTTARITDPEFASLLMADLLFTRRASERFWNLQRQGRLATVAPLTGQEAAVVGVVRALDLETDWFVPYYRDVTGFGALGDEFMEQLVVYWRGHPDGGRIPEGVRCLPVQISLGTQLPHAAGLAWGLALRGDPGVVCTFLGDGATSEGDFYEAINLAGVQRAPLIVVCINNGWAISTPAARQTAAPTFAAKADAAGIPGVRVDGNDVLAVLDATRIARRRAAAGDGPTLARGRHLPHGRPHQLRRPHRATSPTTSCRTGGDAIRSNGSAPSCSARASGTTNVTPRPRSSVEARLERIIDRALARELEPAGGTRPRHRRRRRAHSRAARRDRRSERARRRARRRVRCPRRARRRHRGGVVASMTMLAAIRETIVDEMARDERVVLLGEDVGANGGVFRATDGVARTLRPASRVRHAALGVGDRRRERRPLGRRTGAGGGDPVRRLQHAGVPPDRRPARPHALPQPWPLPLPGHRPRSVRRRRPHPRVPRRLGRRARTHTRRGSTSWSRRTRPTPRGCSPAPSASEDPVLFFEPIPCYRTTGDVPDGEHVVPLGRAEVVRER